MANPGYPNMPGQMPPGMGGPGMQMGGPPGMGGQMGMGGMPNMQRPVRRGTSKAVPVVVSAGLAVGVFCGLLFGVGTGKEASATPTASNAKKITNDDGTEKPDPGSAPKGLGATKTVDAPKPGTGSAAPVAAGSGSAAPAAAKPAVEEKKTIKVKLVVKPEDATKDIKVKIDGKDIDGLVADMPADVKTFKVEIKANGYHTYEKSFSMMGEAGGEMNVELELRKRAAAGTGGVRPPKRPGTPPTASPGGGGGGGLIDI